MTGFAICGSFCSHEAALDVMRFFAESQIELLPILSDNAYTISTRFGTAEDFIRGVERVTGRQPYHTIEQSERLGPEDPLDALIIMPCTGNTLAKLAHGITDSSVTMAAKATMRNSKPVIIGLCTNDALGANLTNIGTMINKKNIYFVPLYQDDHAGKPTSLVCDMSLTYTTYTDALTGKQHQPVVF